MMVPAILIEFIFSSSLPDISILFLVSEEMLSFNRV